MSGGDIVIRPSMAVRVYMVAFGLVWCGVLGSAVVIGLANGVDPVDAIPFVMLIGGGLIVWSNVSMHVVADGDVLLVRNLLRQQRHARSSIDRFVEHGQSTTPSFFGGQLAMLLTDGSLIDLRATRSGPFGRAKRAEDLRRLDGWLDSAR